MPVIDFYSHRKKVDEGKMPDVFVYDELPEKLRIQIIHIWREAIGEFDNYSYDFKFGRPHGNNKGWEQIHNAVAKEHGVPSLTDDPRIDHRCANYLLNADSVEEALDLIEYSFRYIDETARRLNENDRGRYHIRVKADDAVEDLNERFLRAGVGYRFENGMIFPIESELIHNEIVRPALRYLNQQGFEGPRDEFMKAYKHYRAGEMKAAITAANNAFESTLKAICHQRGWEEYKQCAGAADLLKLVRGKGFLPDYLGKSFDQLAATLKSGLPGLRNKEGAHGQGAKPRETPRYVVAYALHLAAAKILFLVEAYHAKNGGR